MPNCSKCKQDKPAEQFPKDVRRRSGLASHCKPCKYRAHSEWRATVGYDRSRTDDRLAEAKRYYQANQERLRERRRERYRANPLKDDAYNMTRNRRIKDASVCGCVSAVGLSTIRRAQGNHCYYCHNPLTVVHWDHKTPLVRGGKHCLNNIAAACPFCNLSKGRKTEAEFLAALIP